MRDKLPQLISPMNIRLFNSSYGVRYICPTLKPPLRHTQGHLPARIRNEQR